MRKELVLVLPFLVTIPLGGCNLKDKIFPSSSEITVKQSEGSKQSNTLGSQETSDAPTKFTGVPLKIADNQPLEVTSFANPTTFTDKPKPALELGSSSTSLSQDQQKIIITGEIKNKANQQIDLSKMKLTVTFYDENDAAVATAVTKPLLNTIASKGTVPFEFKIDVNPRMHHYRIQSGY